jgi:hypothetical protein
MWQCKSADNMRIAIEHRPKWPTFRRMTYFAPRFALRGYFQPLAVATLLVLVLVLATFPGPVRAAERARVEAFLNVTGFDVALDSIALSAASAPLMLGAEPGDFGADWNRLATQVFDIKLMRTLATDILVETLSDRALTHAAGFYASDLGQRLVLAENASHMMKVSDAKQLSGIQIVSDLVASGSPRLELIKRMNMAVNSSGSGVLALQEIQIRFLLAASAAGVIELKMDADDLRAAMKSQEGELRRAMQKSAMAGAAYTYRDFSDADVEAYAVALEHPDMRQVYELLNAVQYEIMANRFEVLASRMAELHPSQDI